VSKDLCNSLLPNSRLEVKLDTETEEAAILLFTNESPRFKASKAF